MGKPRLPENSALIITMLLVVRILSAFYNLIYDCDETYNYWEIGHYLIFKNGYMTWEYSPQFALRSYFYLWCNILPSFIVSFIISNELFLFYLARLFIALFGVFCELNFCIGLSRCAGTGVARYCMAILLMSSGMYFASSSFLPNTLSMHLTMLAYGAWFRDEYKMTIFIAGLSILIGWPYAAIVFIPIAVSMLLSKRKILYFILALVYAVIILTPLIAVDSYYYGKLVVSPLNAVLYNVFNKNGGPELYGVEGFSFYFINLLLNFNLVLVASLFSLPMLILSKIFVTTRKHKMLESSHWICVVSMLTWLLIFSLQSHKEERFMYPIYPLICASAALTIKLVEQFVVGTKQPYSSPVFKVIVCVCCLTFLGLSMSRVLSLYQGFKPTFNVHSDLRRFDHDGLRPILLPTSNAHDQNNANTSGSQYINVCYGKEWYRYPSSFFLPSSRRYRMRFIKSEFRGQLPKLYENDGPKNRGLKTHIIFSDFNDMNKEEESRYISPEKCHYLIDSSQDKTSKYEPDYSLDTKNWLTLSSHKMLDLHRSPIIIRSFYLPFVSERQNSYIDYKLLRNTNLFVNDSLSLPEKTTG